MFEASFSNKALKIAGQTVEITYSVGLGCGAGFYVGKKTFFGISAGFGFSLSIEVYEEDE